MGEIENRKNKSIKTPCRAANGVLSSGPAPQIARGMRQEHSRLGADKIFLKHGDLIMPGSADSPTQTGVAWDLVYSSACSAGHERQWMLSAQIRVRNSRFR